MNKSMLTGVVLGAVVVTAGGAGALALKQNGTLELSGPSYADVMKVEPVTETIRTPREVCHDEIVTHQKQPVDENKIAGSAIGAVIGGVIGKQIGGGNGKKLATVAGAVAGGYAGNKVQGELQARDTYQTTERRCETTVDVKQNTVGYNVTYSFEDKVFNVRMAERPSAERLQVNAEGQLVEPQAKASL
ncbi:MAG: glycine zipper 2TM domain-containing protein [Gammaproteobacteria bacterium]|nr:glycine zipper 2TM domain-containing protein [Gammaproteobacteria bacterium]